MGASVEELKYSSSVDTSRAIFFTSAITAYDVFIPIFKKSLLDGHQHFIIPERLAKGCLYQIFAEARKYASYLKINVKLKGSNTVLALAYFRISHTDVWDLLQ